MQLWKNSIKFQVKRKVSQVSKGIYLCILYVYGRRSISPDDFCIQNFDMIIFEIILISIAVYKYGCHTYM